MVRTSQGTGLSKDLSASQRGELVKAFSMFFTYFNTLGNINTSRVRAARGNWVKNSPQMIASALWLYFMPAVMSEVMAFRGPDDEEDLADWLVRINFSYLASPYPIARNMVSSWAQGFDFQLTPTSVAFTDTIRLANQGTKLVKGEEVNVRRALKSVATVATVVSGGRVPLTRQVQITLEGIYDGLNDGDFQVTDLSHHRRGKRN